MAGIIHKIEEKLGLGGKKEGETHAGEGYKGGDHKPEHGYAEPIKPGHGYSGGEHKPEHGYGTGEHKPEHKEGIVEKIKEKIHGGDGAEHGESKDKKKKKKKDKKKHDDGHSSSSDSDSD